MVIIDKLRQTGAEFSTKDLKYFLSQSRKKTKNLRNSHAPTLSATVPELEITSHMINLTPEEEAQLERDIKMLPEISIKRMSNQPLHPDDKKVCETQKIKVQMIMFKRKLQQQQLQRKARAQNQINTAEGSRSGSKLTRAQQRRQHDSVGALPSQ